MGCVTGWGSLTLQKAPMRKLKGKRRRKLIRIDLMIILEKKAPEEREKWRKIIKYKRNWSEKTYV